MAEIGIVGGGIGGLAVALFLGRRGHRVTVFERDGHRTGDSADRDFFAWRRPGVPQAVQPHGLLAPVRTVLRAEAPEVYAAMLRAGAREYRELDWFAEPAPYRPGDEDLVTVQTRRIVLEAALQDAVEREPGVVVRRGDPVEGLLLAPGPGGVPRVTGLHTGSGSYNAELVVDAGGRRSPVTRWVGAAGGRGAVTETHRTGITYFCRWYRLRPEGPRNAGRVKAGSATAFAIGGVFPSDNDTFAVALTLYSGDPTRGALRDPAVFDAAARTFPAPAAWLALGPEPVSAVHAMAGLDNRWTALVDDAGPVVTGLIGVGDAATHTNPTLGQGVALALRTAQHVARHADRVSADPAGFAAEHHRWALRALRPWFDAQVAADRAQHARMRSAAEGFGSAEGSGSERSGSEGSGSEGSGSAEQAAPPRESALLAACAYDDPVVMRARARVRHLVVLAEEAYGADEVRDRVARWAASHPDFTPAFDGPSRRTWESTVRAARAASVSGAGPVRPPGGR